MSKESAKLAFKAVAKVDKYADGVTQEQIDSGEAKPFETVESEDILYLTPQEAEDLGYKQIK
jgi:hypothetical protein